MPEIVILAERILKTCLKTDRQVAFPSISESDRKLFAVGSCTWPSSIVTFCKVVGGGF